MCVVFLNIKEDNFNMNIVATVYAVEECVFLPATQYQSEQRECCCVI